MPISTIFRGYKKMRPAKQVASFEDMSIKDPVLSKFVHLRTGSTKLFYFRLHPDSGHTKLDSLPSREAGVVLLNPLDLKDEVFGSEGPTVSRYLFAIDQDGIQVGKEDVETLALRRRLTHTNLCPKTAYFGGEVFFLSDDHVILTRNSGRYGLPSFSNSNPAEELHAFQMRWTKAVECWRICGYSTYLTAADLETPEQFKKRNWNGRIFAQASSQIFARTLK